MDVAIYVRVSTQEQKLRGLSVAAQETACRAWVEERGHRLTAVYNDAGLSARTKYTGRRAMLQLLDDVRAGRIGLIIFTKLDRWFRSVADYYEVQAILEAHGVRWRAIQEDYETETASGRFKVNIMLAVAQDEADRTSERIRAAAAYKRAKGEAVGRPALGYVIRDKHWAFDPGTHDGMAAFFAAYLATFSVRAAVRAAAEHGLRLSPAHAGRILRNPTYMGDAFGVPCPAYITGEEFAALRAHAGERTRVNRTTGRVYLFSGLLRCGCCGGMLTSAAVTKAGHTVKYYRCLRHYRDPEACPAGCYANEEKLEAQLRVKLAGVLAGYRVRAVTRAGNAPALPDPGVLRGKLGRLRELYIEGDIDRAVYEERAAVLKRELSEAETAPPAPPEVRLPSDPLTAYGLLPEAQRKIFWKRIARTVVIRADRPPLVFFL